MKKIISMVLALSLLCTVGAAYAEGPGERGAPAVDKVVCAAVTVAVQTNPVMQSSRQ